LTGIDQSTFNVTAFKITVLRSLGYSTADLSIIQILFSNKRDISVGVYFLTADQTGDATRLFNTLSTNLNALTGFPASSATLTSQVVALPSTTALNRITSGVPRTSGIRGPTSQSLTSGAGVVADTKSGLTTGDKIAIGVLVPVGVLIIIAIIIVIVVRSKRTTRRGDGDIERNNAINMKPLQNATAKSVVVSKPPQSDQISDSSSESESETDSSSSRSRSSTSASSKASSSSSSDSESGSSDSESSK